jgi:phosphatidylglycerophosphate synthase
MNLVNVRVKIDPSLAGKLTTVLQVMAVIGIFIQWPYSSILWWVIVVLAVGTTIDYIKRNLQSTPK